MSCGGPLPAGGGARIASHRVPHNYSVQFYVIIYDVLREVYRVDRVTRTAAISNNHCDNNVFIMYDTCARDARV